MAMFSTYGAIYSHVPHDSSPRHAHVPLFISGIYQCGSFEVTPLLRPFTHVAEFGLDVDIRDSYPGQAGSWLLGNSDTLILEDPADMAFVVIFVEEYVNASNTRVQRVYLDRLAVGWPIER